MTARFRGLAFALASALLVSGVALGGCRPAPAPQPGATIPPPTAAPLPTVAATDTPARVATAAAQPTEAVVATSTPENDTGRLPSGWQREATDQLSIAIPPGWRVIDLSGTDAQAAFQGLQKNDPQLAGIIGGPDALTGAAFWAFGPAGGEFVDNLNIRRSPLGANGVTDMQEVIDVLLPEYEKMGLTVTSSDAALRVNGWPAARVTYTLSINSQGGQPFEVRGRQIILATETDLWILSFSTTPGAEGALAGVFETSAQSFRPQ